MAVDTVIGTPTRRVDALEKLTGQCKYAGDLQLPGMLHARLVVSPYAHARILAIDKSAAERLPGVIVLVAADLPIVEREGSRKGEPLAAREALFHGHPVAIVLAESEAIAEDAVALVEVSYEPLTAVMELDAALAENAPLVRDQPLSASDETNAHASVGGGQEEPTAPLSPNASKQSHLHRGDVTTGFQQADVVVEETFRTQWAHQSSIEPQTAVAWLDPTGVLTIWSSTQSVFFPRQEIAKLLGLPARRVKVVGMPVGGGFGAKLMLIEPLIASVAMAVKRPVRLAFTRSEELLATNPAPRAEIQIKVGARKDGTLSALQARITYDTGAFPGSPLDICGTLIGSTYRCPNLDVRGVEVMTHRVSPAAYRAPGAPQAYFALESAIDELARRLDVNPLELRLKNAVVEGDPMLSGRPWPRIGLVECLEKARAHPLWQQRTSLGPNEGIGIAVGGWPGGLMPSNAGCRMEPDGTFTVLTGSIDLTGTNTSFALITAQVLGVPVEKVQVVNGDTDTAPFGPVAGGSMTTYMVGGAVQRAAERAREQVLAIAADQLEAAPEDLEIADGLVRVKGVPDRSVSLERVAGLSMSFGGRYEPVHGQGSKGQAPNAPGFTVHIARVKIDPTTGEVTLRDYAAIQDVGKAINPAAVHGQIMGGIVQGVGWALREAMVYDEGGQLLTGTLMDYALPTALDVPMLQTELVEVPAPDGPFGAKGVGEPPAIPGPAAIGNAIRDAIGARLTDLPMTSERVRAARGQ
ncbi:MAG: xanthine dehydrogenase family protein molybdopterin-binding subunit [Chloroflexota bacterium]